MSPLLQRQLLRQQKFIQLAFPGFKTSRLVKKLIVSGKTNNAGTTNTTPLFKGNPYSLTTDVTDITDILRWHQAYYPLAV